MISLRDWLIGLILLLLFSLCSWATRETGYDHQRRVNTLFQEIMVERQSLLETIVRANNHFNATYSEPDKSVTAITRAMDELDRLFRDPTYQDHPELVSDLAKAREELKLDFQAIDEFKRERALHRDSLLYLPRAYREARASASPEDQRALKDVYLETLVNHQNLEERYRLPVAEDLKALSSPPNPTTRLFLAHVNTILSADPGRFARLQEVLEASDSKTLARLQEDYHGIYRGWEHRRRVLVGIQYAMFILLLGFLARTLAKLNHTIGLVHSINLDLEKRVQERTASLEQSYQRERSYQLELTRSQRLGSVGQLAAGIAHEINTPIQFVGDNTRFLHNTFDEIREIFSRLEAHPEKTVNELISTEDLEDLTKEIPVAIDQSLAGLGRVSEMVRSIKAFSHPGSPTKEETDINVMLRDTITLARNEWRYFAEVDFQLEEKLPRVACYPSDLSQVILNLIVNAAHAIQDKIGRDPIRKGQIGVVTRNQGSALVIQISDSGIGMSDEVLQKVFEPFFTTKEFGRGTGQGLSIAYDIIVHKHGGKLTCQSKPGVGSCFIISIPLPVLAQESKRIAG